MKDKLLETVSWGKYVYRYQKARAINERRLKAVQVNAGRAT